MKKDFNSVELALRVASNAHMGQFDKSGKPYIFHPLHLASQLMYDPELATIAMLHDVPEDTLVNIEDLIEYGFSNRVIEALILLTHKEGVPYDEYIEGICTNLDAITVKRKDLQHNSDITRLKGVKTKDVDRLVKYHRAFIRLGEARDSLKKEDLKNEKDLT